MGLLVWLVFLRFLEGFLGFYWFLHWICKVSLVFNGLEAGMALDAPRSPEDSKPASRLHGDLEAPRLPGGLKVNLPKTKENQPNQ